MPALRTRDTRSNTANALELVLDPSSSHPQPPPLSISIISPTPRTAAFSFPVTHNLADSPYSSPSNSPFEPDLRGLDLSPASTPVGSGDDDDYKPPPPPPAAPVPGSATFTFSSKPSYAGPPPPKPLPLSAFTRTLSPLPLPILTTTTQPTGPSRRKSSSASSAAASSSAAGERRPKKGDEDYVKRPENAFILFRRQACAERDAALPTSVSAPASLVDAPNSAAPGKKARQADLSKTISAQWRALPAEERAKWEEMAKEKKREHAERYPGYVYRPQRRGAAAAAAAAAAASIEPGTTFVNTHPTSPPTKRRKASAPTPAPVEFVLPAARPRSQSHNPTTTSRRSPVPYQSIQIPNVYSTSSSSSAAQSLLVPSFDPHAQDMSLLPMIAQSSQRGQDGAGGFDYLPSFGSALEFEASLQASDFLRAMFPPSNAPPSFPPLSLSSSSESPASSTTSGSNPSSPYTPAASVVSHSYSHSHSQYGMPMTPTPGALLEAAYCGSESLLAQPYSLSGEMGMGTDPWAAYGGGGYNHHHQTGNVQGGEMDFDFDFDLASIPSVGGGWATAGASEEQEQEERTETYVPSADAVQGGQPMSMSMDGDNKGDYGYSVDFGMSMSMGMGMAGDVDGMEGWNGHGHGMQWTGEDQGAF
ncbi:hypothetical protein C8F01DRAFT_1251457 [Mycena amicta]|nr:hypothetical protein C8F01DRAFT_1251457 [Mycena amicta]